jgi:hypothetical protein
LQEERKVEAFKDDEKGYRELKDNEKGYQDWMAANPTGYVVNWYRSPDVPWRLHRARCWTIDPARTPNQTRGQYYKVCSNSVDKLKELAKRKSEPTFGACAKCNPLAP